MWRWRKKTQLNNFRLNCLFTYLIIFVHSMKRQSMSADWKCLTAFFPSPSILHLHLFFILPPPFTTSFCHHHFNINYKNKWIVLTTNSSKMTLNKKKLGDKKSKNYDCSELRTPIDWIFFHSLSTNLFTHPKSKDNNKKKN